MKLREFIHQIDPAQPVQLVRYDYGKRFYSESMSARSLYGEIGDLSEAQIGNVQATGTISITILPLT